MPEDTKGCADCPTIKYRQLYDEYRTTRTFECMDEFLRPETYEERCKQVDTGYRVNKNTSDVIYWDAVHNVLSFKVFDHIRVIEETLAGMFSVDNDEFKMILRPFLKEYFMGHVYLVYSEGVKNLETKFIKKRSFAIGEDPYERIEKSYPDSNFRLLRRTMRNGNWEWDALLSNITNIKINDKKGDFKPIRFTFNEGYFFLRLYHIFMNYEAQMQTYSRLFQVLHTAVIIKGHDRTTIDNKAKEILSGHIHITQETSDLKTGTSANTTELVKDMPYLKESYDLIQGQLNDSLARLGLGADDSAKPERMTTGENFKAMKPTMTYIQSMLAEFENMSYRIQTHLKQSVHFHETVQASESGVPFGKQMKKEASPANEALVSNDKN